MTIAKQTDLNLVKEIESNHRRFSININKECKNRNAGKVRPRVKLIWVEAKKYKVSIYERNLSHPVWKQNSREIRLSQQEDITLFVQNPEKLAY